MLQQTTLAWKASSPTLPSRVLICYVEARLQITALWIKFS